MSLLITMLTAAVGVLFFVSALVKLSEGRRLLRVVGTVQVMAALGLTVPLLLQQEMWLMPVSALVLTVILMFGVLPVTPGPIDSRVFLMMCAPAAFMAYIPGPDVLGITSETGERG